MAEEHSERYGVSDDEADIERVRPAMLPEAREPGLAMSSPASTATAGRKPADGQGSPQ